MEALLYTVLVVILYVLYIILIPATMLVATPFILLWPGKKRSDGTREDRPIRNRYARIWKILGSFGY